MNKRPIVEVIKDLIEYLNIQDEVAGAHEGENGEIVVYSSKKIDCPSRYEGYPVVSSVYSCDQK